MSDAMHDPATNFPPVGGYVPATYVALLFDYLAQQGLRADEVMPAELAEVDPKTQLCTATQWRQMLAMAADHLQDPVLGLRMGSMITPAHLGPLGYVLNASSSAQEALARYLRYQRLVHDVSPVESRVEEGALILEWSSESRAVGILVNQCGIGGLVQFARNITGTDVVPLLVEFVEPEPADTAPYHTFFRCPVHFGAPATRVRFEAGILDQPLHQSDAALVGMLERHVEAMFAALPQRNQLVENIRRLILKQLVMGEPSLDRCAEWLSLSGRTLRRHLQQEGWSFRALTEDTRRQMAESYLRDQRLALPEIALLLGYSEQSAFNRAFRRWYGVAPRQWLQSGVR